MHLASLYHDDVMDEATRRRSVDSVNARWGNLVAIVAGDFLLARSAEIAASLGTEVAGLLAATLARLCQGQVSEVQAAFQIDRDEKDYLGAIANKTAALMSTACRIGAITAGLDRAQIDDLTSFGEYFGMVFQIRDDVLDVIATERSSARRQDRTSPRASTPCPSSVHSRTASTVPACGICSGSRSRRPSETLPAH